MAQDGPLKIGLLVGREWSWPPAFIDEVNRRNEGVIAEFVKLGGTPMNEPNPYRVLVDRISHEVPYYRTYLKNAALQGVKCVNDPFMWSADDKFFGASLITQLGLASPKTLVLPNKDYVPGIVHTESLRNLIYPMDWDWIVSYVGIPCVLKDAHGGGWKDVYVVHSKEELIARYNQSGLLTMVLQEFIDWDEYARCMVLGQQDINVMRYDPRTRYYQDEHGFKPELYERLVHDSLLICRALGYDMNTCEYAIKNGMPYAIDFMNCAPDMDVNSLGRKNFEWAVKHMADMTIRYARSGARTAERYYWGNMGPEPAEVVAATRKPARKAATKAKRTTKTTTRKSTRKSGATGE